MTSANSARVVELTVRGANNATGIGVVEAYELDRTVDSKLANISTRGLVQSDPNILIAGTIILGQSGQKVIVRAIGPSLSVPGKLDDPAFELRDQNGGLIEANDNWVDSPNKQAIIDSTIPPTDDMESAIVRTLPAGGASYTAIVRGAGNTSGIEARLSSSQRPGILVRTITHEMMAPTSITIVVVRNDRNRLLRTVDQNCG